VLRHIPGTALRANVIKSDASIKNIQQKLLSIISRRRENRISSQLRISSKDDSNSVMSNHVKNDKACTTNDIYDSHTNNTNINSKSNINKEYDEDDSGFADTLLDYLLDASDDDPTNPNASNVKLTDKEVLDQAMTFFIAGHETTAQLLTWTLYLLSKHPEWKLKAREQVWRVIGKDGEIQYEDLSEMSFLGMILYESMRLLPPVPNVIREALTDMKIGKYEIKKGTSIVIDNVGLHTNQEYWDNPEEFDPMRFENGISGACKKHPMSFSPFAHGPRNCIGAQFALQEAKIVLAVLLQKLDFELSSNYVHWPLASITLRPKEGMPVVFKML
jgi:cytochrome P450